MTLTRTSTLKRTPFKRKPGATTKGTRAPRTRLKSKGPKMTPIRRSARGEACTLLIPGCPNDASTVVLCHSNRLADGKGMGLKAPDTAACYGCGYCHDILDGRAPRPAGLTLEAVEGLFDRAVKLTHARLREKGIEL